MGKKKKRPVFFTVNERRALGLPIADDITGNEAEVLRKILDTYPWMVSVADCHYDLGVAKASLSFHQAKVQLQDAMEKAKKRP